MRSHVQHAAFSTPHLVKIIVLFFTIRILIGFTILYTFVSCYVAITVIDFECHLSVDNSRALHFKTSTTILQSKLEIYWQLMSDSQVTMVNTLQYKYKYNEVLTLA